MTSQLWKKAERDLRISVHGWPPDPIVWEHSARVARTAEMIARLPEVAAQAPHTEAVVVAALYHGMGWVLQVQAGQISPDELLLRPTSDFCRDIAADWMDAHLPTIVPGGVLERAVAAVRKAGDRRTDMIEAQILAEADNLDQIGPPFIERMIRKCRHDGRTMEQLLASWERQEEYQYWQARIKESVRFASLRELAERRHQALRRFMADLAVAVRLEDVAVFGVPGQAGSRLLS